MEDTDSYRPGFFEVYAANHLSSALRPAFRFALEVLSIRHPFLVRLAAHSDEVFTGLLLVLETSQLRKENALLAESFYSLRRSKSMSFRPTDMPETPLNGIQVALSILFSVVLPHARVKLDTWYTSATGGPVADLFADDARQEPPQGHHRISALRASLTSADSSSEGHAPMGGEVPNPLHDLKMCLQRVKQVLASPSVRRIALTWYPRISACCEGTNLLLNMSYLFGHTKFFSLALIFQRLVLRRASAGEAMRSLTRRTPFFSEGSVWLDLSQILAASSERVLALFKAGFFVGVFAFRFLQYYYAAEASTPRENGPIISPPQPLPPVAGIDSKTAAATRYCPLCGRRRVNPTACRSANCPITLAPTQAEDLIRVYEDADSG